MRFQTRLLFTYSVLVFFLTVVLSITFYSYTSRLFEDNAASTYRLLSSRMSLHLDNLIRPVDFITTNPFSLVVIVFVSAMTGWSSSRRPSS